MTSNKKISKELKSTILSFLALLEDFGDLALTLSKLQSKDSKNYKILQKISKDREALTELLDKLPRDVAGEFVVSVMKTQNELSKINKIMELDVEEQKHVGKNIKEAAENLKKMMEK